MHCHRCGQFNIKEAQICSQCGAKLQQHTTTSKVTVSQAEYHAIEQAQDHKQISLWNPNSAASLGILFSPAFSAYIHMKNWEALDEPIYAKSSKEWFVISAILSLFGFGFVVLAVWYFVLGRTQIQYIQDKVGNSYQEKAWMKPVMFGVVFIIVMILIGFVVST